MVKTAGDQSANEVTTDSEGVVVATLRGRQTADSIRSLGARTEAMLTATPPGDKKLLLADIRNLLPGDITSEARVEIRKSFSGAHFDACALVGTGKLLGTVMYMLRLTGLTNKVHFFTSEHAAQAWLQDIGHPKVVTNTSVSLVSGIAIGLIGILALVGWQLGNVHLTRWLPSLRPINPMAAVGLLAIGVGFVSYWREKLNILKCMGVFGIVLGVTALLPLSIDHLLFGGKVAAAGGHTDLADSAAICFIAMGLTPFTVGTKRFAVRLLQYALAITIIGLGLFNIFGQLYAHDFIYSISPTFVMAFNLAVAFAAAGITLVLLVLYKQVGNVLNSVTRIGWLIVAALLFVQVATYSAWAQVVSRNQASAAQAFISRSDDIDQALKQRIDAYTNALYGFKGLFVSSDYVDQGEFQSYYDSLNLVSTYPGLRALAFISKVQTKDVNAFVAQHRADASLHAGGNPAFTVPELSALPTHYIVTYDATTGAASGTDLGLSPERLAALQKADAANGPVGSGTVTLAATATQPEQPGFFIVLPVPSKTSGKASVGFVTAVFSYNEFFGKVFAQKDLLKNVDLKITDSKDGSITYASRLGGPAKNITHSGFSSIGIADRSWNVRLGAPASFGVSQGQLVLPRTMLIGGQLFALLLIFIFVVQARARRQGFELADTITEDLVHERNSAVSSDQKSLAILNSIGDAVFAIDLSKRITLFNPSAQQMSGYSEEEAIGKPYTEILKFEYEKDGRVNDRFIQEALAGQYAKMSNHTLLIRKDGTRVQVADSAAPIRDAKQMIIGAIIVFRDVSKDYELDKAKTEFVSLASHQLRTPLSAINWYGEMLLNGDAGQLNDKQHEYIKEIFDGNQRMVGLVNSLLDVSRLEVGKLGAAPIPNDLGALIEGVQKDLAILITEKQLNIINDIAKLPQVVADPKQLRMIIQSIINNAVTYTPPKGKITIIAHQATAEEVVKARLDSAASYWFFSVSDTGYGIPKAQQPKVFTKLFRADNVRVLDTVGAGLGLYMVREMVNDLGGKVWFDSTESVGTTFYVVAPFSPKHTK